MTRVLIVDDKPDNLDFLSALLQEHKCVVDEARHGAEALIKARQNPPDLVISDLLMPVMDGYTLLSRWKADKRLNNIPFIVYTAICTDPEDEKLALDLGADDFILKPIEPEPFVARLQEMLAKARRGEWSPTRTPKGDEEALKTDYSEILIRKLEQKSLKLNEANRALQAEVVRLQEARAEANRVQQEAERAREALLSILEDQRKTEEDLRNAKAYAENLVASANAMVIGLDDKGTIQVFNEAAEKITGYGKAELAGKNWFEVVVPKERYPQVWEEFSRMKEGGLPREFENPILTKDGEERIISWRNSELREQDKIVGTISFGIDITERKRAESALGESRALYHSLVEQLPTAIFRKNAAGRYVFVNFQYCQLKRMNVEDFLGKTPAEVADAELAKPAGRRGLATRFQAEGEEHHEMIMRTGECVEKEEDYPGADGGMRIMHALKTPVFDSEGKIVGTQGILFDITERKRAEEDLRNREMQLRLALDAARMGTWDWDIKTGRVVWSAGHEALWGYAPGTFPGTYDGYESRLHPDDVEGARRAGQKALDGHSNYEHEYRVCWPDGTMRWIAARGQAVYGTDGEPTRMSGVAMDITERKRAELNQQLTTEILRVLNQGGDLRPFIGETIRLIKESTGFDAVGLRLREGDDFPYYITDGFPEDFVCAERYLCARDQAGELLRDSKGNPVLECMCGNILCGRTNPALPFFTKGGSFWTNSTSHLLVTATEADRQARTRNRCHGEGYESVALIPLRSGDEVIGLLQLNDRREGRFTLEMIQFFEGLSTSVGFALKRAQAETALRESQALYSSLVEQLPMGVFRKDKQGRFVFVNSWFCRLRGAKLEEFLGRTPAEFDAAQNAKQRITSSDQKMYPRLVTQGEEHHRLILQTGQQIEVEEEWPGEAGKARYLDVVKLPVHGPDGKIIGSQGIQFDITERKLAEQEAERAAREWQSTFDATNDAIWILDKDHSVLRSNKTAERYFKQPCREMIGKHCWKIVHGTTEPIPGCPFERAQKSHKRETMELWQNNHCYEIIIDPIIDAANRYVGGVHIVSDITERRHAEERIREQATLLDAANDAIYVRALDHTVTYWNDGAERTYGWTRAEALGRKITELGDVDHAAFDTAHSAVLERGSWSGELKKISKSGKEFVVFCRWTMLRDEQGRPKEVLAINTDITERKQLETSFLRAQRMEGIGALAAGIAHDLNNILSPILMAAPILRGSLKDNESRAMLKTVENCAVRGADIIKQLLTFARGKPGARVPLPVRHLLRDIDKIVRETFPRNIRLLGDAPKELWPVMGDATQIHQALMNLCVNARDAMPDGGALTLAAENLTFDEVSAAMVTGAVPGNYVRVSVTDTGMGIPPEHMEHMFEPFFTTKEVGKGTGLGLSTVLGIARGHGGFLQVRSKVGQGSTFELYLPASPEEKAVEPVGGEKPLPRGNGEVILVVDDEAPVRHVMESILRKNGYQVLLATEGNEAVLVLNKHRTEVKAIITDMMMPGMDGPSLVRAVQKSDPGLHILGMTGLSDLSEVKGLKDFTLPVMLIKPFDASTLLTKLRQVLTTAAK